MRDSCAMKHYIFYGTSAAFLFLLLKIYIIACFNNQRERPAANSLLQHPAEVGVVVTPEPPLQDFSAPDGRTRATTRRHFFSVRRARARVRAVFRYFPTPATPSFCRSPTRPRANEDRVPFDPREPELYRKFGAQHFHLVSRFRWKGEDERRSL